MTYLGIDFGKARIGLAVARDPYILATPLLTIQNTDNAPLQIAQIVNSEKVSKIVIGKPVSLKGKNEQAVQDVEAWTRDTLLPVLKSQLKSYPENMLPENQLPEIVFIDERLTTASAKKMFLAANSKSTPDAHKKQKKVIDQMAAVEILNTILC
ncbi:MAG: Holliday junction resolvase RuvX [Bifidobacteriaceae bacterium]|jgi:putative Holliday junction resolvase|nr:Holliday junction resolvase RuvX [Bifidobacteriaceae bacterium]